MTAPQKGPFSEAGALYGQDIGQEQEELLHLIDQIRQSEIEGIPLPRIVAVGDQSVGKSSVLEAITGIPFPQASIACTRFATEVRLRPAKQRRFQVHILPDESRPLYQRARLLTFATTVLENTDFETIMHKALIEIANPDIPRRFAFKDTLVLEMCAPSLPLLTVVDLPGLITHDVDRSEENKKTIDDLANAYMKSSQTIILAIVGSNADCALQRVLERAKHFDPRGNRTIGVLTKPDLAPTTELENEFIALVNNQATDAQFKLGWFVLRNPGPRKRGHRWTSEERRQQEDEFFSQSRWNTIPTTMRGSNALKHKLSQQVMSHITRYIPGLRKELHDRLVQIEADLKSLDTGKDTPAEVREHLISLSLQSSKVVEEATTGTYRNPIGYKFFAQSTVRHPRFLRTRIVSENERFARELREQRPDLDSISYSVSSSSMRVQENILKEQYAQEVIESFLRERPGTGLAADYDPLVVYELFRNFSDKWGPLAQEHTRKIGIICSEFLTEVIDCVWPTHMHQKLRAHFLDPQMNQHLGNAEQELAKLVDVRTYTGLTYDSEYGERLAKWRAAAVTEGRQFSQNEELLEKTLIYYDLSAKIFIHNVITQVVELHLVRGLGDLFNPVKVAKMKGQEIKDIAIESVEIAEKRMALKRMKNTIEESLDACANINIELRAFAGEGFNAIDENTLGDQSQLNEAANTDEHGGALSGANDLGVTSRNQAPKVAPASGDEEISDIVSIISIDGPPSLTTGSTLSDTFKIFTSAAEEFAEILLGDNVLQQLLPAAFERAGPERFKRNFARLIAKYAMNLRAEARTQNQSEAARLVRSRAKHIAYIIARSMQPTKETLAVPQATVSTLEREVDLERFLEQLVPHSKLDLDPDASDLEPNPDASDLEPNLDEQEEDEADEPETPRLSNLDEVKRFMIESKAFQNLREDFRHFTFPIRPTNIPTLITGTEKHQSRYLRSLSEWMVKIYNSALKNFGLIEQELAPGYHRVQWTCTCGQTFHEDFLASESSNAVHLCQLLSASGYETLITDGGSAGEIDMELGNLPTTGTRSDSHDSAAHALRHTTLATAAEAENSSATKLMPSQYRGVASDAKSENQRWLLLCFDFYRYAGKAVHIPLEYQSDDVIIFSIFREKYFKSRSLIGRLSSWKEVKAISFVKLRLDPRTGDIPTICDDWDPPTEWPMAHEWESLGRKPDIPSSWLLHHWYHPHDALAFRTKQKIKAGLHLTATTLLRWFRLLIHRASVGALRERKGSSRHPVSDHSVSNAVENEASNGNVFVPPLERAGLCENTRINASVIINATPKKIVRELVASPDDPPYGWGIYLHEGFAVPEVIRTFALFLLFCLLFGVLVYCAKVFVKYGFGVFGIWGITISLCSLMATLLSRYTDSRRST